MKAWVRDRPWDALLKTLALLAVIHAAALGLGSLFGVSVGAFGLRCFWPHFSLGPYAAVIMLVLFCLVYWAVYTTFTEPDDR